MSRRDEIGIAFFGSWMVIGLYLDGWAHNNDKPETFFTPWHGVLYSGFAAAVIFFTLADFGSRRRGVTTPPADRLTIAGLVLFIIGAVGDFVWHEIFGIEINLEALLSPTHLALMTGGLLMLTGPIRSAWNRDDRDVRSLRFLPTLVCITLCVLVVSFFTMYFSAFRFGGLHSDDGGFIGTLQELHGLASIFVTNAILMSTTLIVVRRWRTPRGSFVFLYTVVAFAMVAMDSFRFPLLVMSAVIAGLVADLAVDGLRPFRARLWATRVFALVVPLALWGSWLVAVNATSGVTWAIELWTGAVILAALTGLGMSVVALPPRRAPAVMMPEPEPATTAPPGGPLPTSFPQ